MSNFNFCPSCGQKHTAQFSFCGHCGASLKSFLASPTQAVAAQAPPTAPAPAPVRQPRVLINDEDEEDILCPDITEFKVNITNVKSSVVKISDIIGTGRTVEAGEMDRPKMTKKEMSKKSFLQAWSNEAGNSKKNIEIGGE